MFVKILIKKQILNIYFYLQNKYKKDSRNKREYQVRFEYERDLKTINKLSKRELERMKDDEDILKLSDAWFD